MRNASDGTFVVDLSFDLPEALIPHLHMGYRSGEGGVGLSVAADTIYASRALTLAIGRARTELGKAMERLGETFDIPEPYHSQVVKPSAYPKAPPRAVRPRTVLSDAARRRLMESPAALVLLTDTAPAA